MVQAGNDKKKVQNDFEESYFRIRSLEKRIYPDEIVQSLPGISRSDTHYPEWKLRQQSTRRLLQYLEKKKKPLEILEVGCGNGWLSHQLSTVKNTTVTGLDLHLKELEQASKVFASVPNLDFMHGNFLSLVFDRKFDLVVFAASIQYFEGLAEVISVAKRCLKPRGEIHILDSHFYEEDEVSFASSRSEAYFTKMKAPAMSKYYYHHSISELERFDHKILNRPTGLGRFLPLRSSPFPWVVII